MAEQILCWNHQNMFHLRLTPCALSEEFPFLCNTSLNQTLFVVGRMPLPASPHAFSLASACQMVKQLFSMYMRFGSPLMSCSMLQYIAIRYWPNIIAIYCNPMCFSQGEGVELLCNNKCLIFLCFPPSTPISDSWLRPALHPFTALDSVTQRVYKLFASGPHSGYCTRRIKG